MQIGYMAMQPRDVQARARYMTLYRLLSPRSRVVVAIFSLLYRLFISYD